MGYVTKLQVIKRANDTRQFYVICPAPLAQALEMEPGEELEWVVEERPGRLSGCANIIRRINGSPECRASVRTRCRTFG